MNPETVDYEASLCGMCRHVRVCRLVREVEHAAHDVMIRVKLAVNECNQHHNAVGEKQVQAAREAVE